MEYLTSLELATDAWRASVLPITLPIHIRSNNLQVVPIQYNTRTILDSWLIIQIYLSRLRLSLPLLRFDY